MVGVNSGLGDLALSSLCINMSQINLGSSCFAITFILITMERMEQKGSISFVQRPVCRYFSNGDDVTDERLCVRGVSSSWITVKLITTAVLQQYVFNTS